MHDDPVALSLPWYVNGTLSDTGRASIARQLRSDPALRNELAFWEQLAASQRQHHTASEDIGLARTLERIRCETREQAPPHSERRGLREHLGRWLGGGERWLRPALACALLVIVVQAGVHHLDRPALAPTMRGAEPTRSVPAPTPLPANSALLRVVFHPSTTEGEIRLLIAEQDGWIVGGPGEGGEYYLAVPMQRVIAATDALRRKSAVRDVAGVDVLPKPR